MKQTRQSIVNLLIEKLAQIRVTNGYSCDIGQLVEYAEGVSDEPVLDCCAVFDGKEDMGLATARNNANRLRTLSVNIHAAFIGNSPKVRANAAVEDMITWLDKNPSLGQVGVLVKLNGFDVELEKLGELAELICELDITY